MKIALSCGDCNGIGMEVMLKALLELQAQPFFRTIDVCIVTHPQTLHEYIQQIQIQASVRNDLLTLDSRSYRILPCTKYARVHFGEEHHDAGRLAFEALEICAALVRREEVDAVVTMPVSKASLHSAGFEYPGQTEFFAARSLSERDALMILCHESLRVALQTVHCALREVPSRLSVPSIVSVLKSFHQSLVVDYGISHPKISVLALNPHAGESGHIGVDEVTTIIPALEQARACDIDAHGPFAADGFFAHGAYKNYDGVLAMYHDQGLIPLKLLAGGAGVNFSASLPLVRTSPDHGTAMNIAGKNMADATSTVNAIRLAIDIAERRKAQA